jgi:bile acid:Na+ symporter, BASS family
MFYPFRSALHFIGRHAPVAYALSIVLGLALPQLAASLRPLIPISIFTFIVMSFARASLPGLRLVLGRPLRLSAGLMISTLLPPLIGALIIVLIPGLDPGIRLGIALMAAAPPLMASPVFTAVVGLENSFALIILVAGMVISPLVSPAFATLLAGAEVPITPMALAQRLAIFVGGGMLTGLAFRLLAGTSRITAWKNELDGIGVLLFFLFAIAAMDGVIVATLNDPLWMLGVLAASCLFQIAGFATSYALAGHLGFNDRFSLAISVGLRNMGLLMAPIISLVPPKTFLYFALAQIPIYVAPVILKGVKDWLTPATTPEPRG